MFGRGFRRRSANRSAVNTAARRSNRRRGQPNAVADPVTTYQRSASNVPIKQVKQPVIRPAVDPMRPRFIGHSGTGTPTGGLPAVKPTKRPVLKKIQPVIRPVVDEFPPMSMPQYSEGGFVRTPKSNFGTTDYRKTGLTKSTHVKKK